MDSSTFRSDSLYVPLGFTGIRINLLRGYQRRIAARTTRMERIFSCLPAPLRRLRGESELSTTLRHALSESALPEDWAQLAKVVDERDYAIFDDAGPGVVMPPAARAALFEHVLANTIRRRPMRQEAEALQLLLESKPLLRSLSADVMRELSWCIVNSRYRVRWLAARVVSEVHAQPWSFTVETRRNTIHLLCSACDRFGVPQYTQLRALLDLGAPECLAHRVRPIFWRGLVENLANLEKRGPVPSNAASLEDVVEKYCIQSDMWAAVTLACEGLARLSEPVPRELVNDIMRRTSLLSFDAIVAAHRSVDSATAVRSIGAALRKASEPDHVGALLMALLEVAFGATADELTRHRKVPAPLGRVQRRALHHLLGHQEVLEGDHPGTQKVSRYLKAAQLPSSRSGIQRAVAVRLA